MPKEDLDRDDFFYDKSTMAKFMANIATQASSQTEVMHQFIETFKESQKSTNEQFKKIDTTLEKLVEAETKRQIHEEKFNGFKSSTEESNKRIHHRIDKIESDQEKTDKKQDLDNRSLREKVELLERQQNVSCDIAQEKANKILRWQ